MRTNSPIDFNDENALIVMDTNVWLDLYKLPPSAIISIVDVISVHLNKFWLPNQVYIEFNRHMKKSRDEAVDRYKIFKDTACEKLNNVKTTINQEFENLKRNNLLEALQAQKAFNNKMLEIISQIKADLTTLDADYQIEMDCISGNDVIQDLIEKLHTNSNTKGFSINQLIHIYEEGEIRYKYKIAPGYTDIKKKDYESNDDFLLRKYGDLIMWKEILQHVQGTEVKMIFVQNEKKSDWWQSSRIKTISKNLAEEYQVATSDKGRIEMINFEQLLNVYGEKLELPATTVKDIVAKLKLEKDVCKYVDNNKNKIIEEYVFKAYEEDDRIYEILQDISLFGGYVESVYDIEIGNVNIIDSNFDYDKDWDLSYIGAEVEIEGTANIEEYVNKYVSHSGDITFKICFVITVNFSIDFSDFDAEAKDAYVITGYDVEDEKINDLVHGEFDIDVLVDEDMLRDR